MAGNLAASSFLRFVFYLLIRAPHLGFGKPPMYGDYEAQRHWKEITTSLPISQWYVHSEKNDLQYWGLDYPPLTAYHSYAMGKVFQLLLPDVVRYNTSRGYESAASKLLMRLSVLLGDVLVFLPAVYYFVFHSYLTKLTRADKWAVFTLISLCPSLLLIDHGHFQYNNFSLGLAIFAIAFAINNRPLLASIAFSLSLNYKQMSLYYAPVFSFTC